MSIVVLKPGMLTTVQDQGRTGHAALGVGHAGPMDQVAFRLANALVGNPEGAAALEMTLVGPRLRFDTTATVAFTGAPFNALIDGVPVQAWRSTAVGAGSVLDCGRAPSGSRGYLAIAGGLKVDPVLGSCATDVNAQLGPLEGRPVRAGDMFHLCAGVSKDEITGPKTPRLKAAMPWSLDPRPWFDEDPTQPIRLMRGSHFDALDAASRTALFRASFRIAAESNRVGLRLDGPRLTLDAALELISEPTAFGTMQLPPGGQPIVLMAEHATTGGYPRIAQVAAIDLPRLAQRRPGQEVRFSEILIDEAQTRYLRREQELETLIHAIAIRLKTPR